VRLVIADTGPINYLILIGHVDLLPRLFERVVLPSAVQAELANSLAPPAVQRWIADFPAWRSHKRQPWRIHLEFTKAKRQLSRWRRPCTRTYC